MKTLLPLILLSFGLASCVVTNVTPTSGETVKVSGVYQRGHDLTEPRPKSGKYLRVTDGGVAVLKDGAGLYLRTEVITKPDKELFVTVDYDDPQSGTISNTMAFVPSAKVLEFSVPRFQKDLIPYSTYSVTVKVFASKNAPTPIETITQEIRSYVDSRGSSPQVMSRLKTQ